MRSAQSEARWARLMAAGQGGDKAAYAALLHDCVPFICWVGSGVGVSSTALDDLVQDVLLAIHRARHTYDPRQPFTPWLRTIAQRRAIDLLRQSGRLREREQHAPDIYATHPDPAPSPVQALAAGDAGGRLREAVSGLPNGQRQAVELLGLEEMSLEQASSLTGRTKVALKVNLHRALKALRQRLDRDE